MQAAYTHYAAPDSHAGIADSADHYWLGATYQITSAWAVNGAGFYIHVRDGSGDAAHDPASHGMLYALGTTYNFSKRTLLYGTVAICATVLTAPSLYSQRRATPNRAQARLPVNRKRAPILV